MRFVSTRGVGPASLDEALLEGLAADGGLFVPERWPAYSTYQFAAAETVASVASIFLRPFFADSRLGNELLQIIDETFCFPIPIRALPRIRMPAPSKSDATERMA